MTEGESMVSGGGEPLLAVTDLSVDVSSRRGPARVLNSLSFTVGKGEVLGVVGESGCGKSMTVLGILDLLPLGASRISGLANMLATMRSKGARLPKIGW